jgi:hypothetical protein
VFYRLLSFLVDFHTFMSSTGALFIDLRFHEFHKKAPIGRLEWHCLEIGPEAVLFKDFCEFHGLLSFY